MRAVLMAGGSGTRLRPLTCELPKPMVPILNRPIAEHIINLLKRNNITEIITTLHYLPDVIQDYFQDGSDFGVKMKYSVEEDQPLGTAGSVKNIAELLDDTFLVISGDSITDFDLNAAIEFHKSKQSKATIILTRVQNPIDFGVVITDKEQRIQRFLEKPSTSEVFSDTVNIGTYILEPEVLQYIKENEESDFSQDLFPLLLAENEPIYGYIAEGYWCDVGHLEVYREAQYDALHGKVKLDFAYEEKKQGLWVGSNTYIDATAKIQSPTMIGHNCRIGPNVIIEGETIIGDNVTIGGGTQIKRSIIWNGVMIGEEAQLTACTIARGTRIERRAQVAEAAVIGQLSTVGEEAQINNGVRVWPSKRIESGAILNINLIWGSTAQRNLFGQRGVSGLANIDITPEFAVKLGAAYGSTLKPGSMVMVSRDQRSVSRMVSRSIIGGLMSVGVHIQNLQATAIPIARTMTSRLGVVGGIHVRIHPDRPDFLLIEFFDSKGINLSKAKEKKIEGAYFKEDLRRVGIQDIGIISYPANILDTYRNTFEAKLNVEAVRNSSSKIVIDYVYGVSGAILPDFLTKFGCDAVVLNASLRQAALSTQERETLLYQLGQVVEALKGNLGVQVSANGEQFILVDEGGIPIRGEQLTALMVNTILTANPRGTIVVPVHASSAVEQIVRRHDGKIKRTKANPTALMEASQSIPNVVLGGSGDMGFIFPYLHPGFDAMFSIAKLLEMLTIQERSLAQIRAVLPKICHKSTTVRCPWKIKGALMRNFIETHSTEDLELIDGVKIISHHNDNWVLILPDAGEPLVHLYANSEDREWVEQSLKSYRQQVQQFIEQEQGTIISV
ncbi:mannose-1-phosphate guanylyltransferase [Aphanothece hegewaldii CCALA 016]|uniref:Mannose-1-phosphate guanylyltransferase n=1 Tax=Aphanothece hegewaldii CCALA 016 TaxID=2107694 RepID=A0A2T1LXY5_9CHRO|nr:mannose-1-phosphate guanyltransferase [Aphanothece hegewaldii]PSF37243.1 mannose-1-phosphate guanylyltransferase [Aphanothece hegewaldii CCALA 016]